MHAGEETESVAQLGLAVDLADSVQASYELALALAARAVASRSRSDAAHAVSLMHELGIADTPVTSLSDRWPSGGLVARLLGTA
jgi:hypothetical protein